MELMSSLLLFVLVAFLPQGLGKSNMKTLHDMRFNESMIIKRKPLISKNIMVNVNSPSSTDKVSDLQSVFIDPKCKGCLNCMERAIKSHRVHNHFIMDSYPEDLQEPLTKLDSTRRDKRKVNDIDNMKRTKKTKSKKNKSITVFKYVENQKIYALKINETNIQSTSDKFETCNVYSVLKSLPCESPEANSILIKAKTKVNKRSKKDKGPKEAIVTKATEMVPLYKKRPNDDSVTSEHFMLSIEEIY